MGLAAYKYWNQKGSGLPPPTQTDPHVCWLLCCKTFPTPLSSAKGQKELNEVQELILATLMIISPFHQTIETSCSSGVA
jgi:hypothetical protein